MLYKTLKVQELKCLYQISANNLNDTTNIMTFHFSLKPIAIELRTVIVCILCKLRIYGPPLHKNSWETRKWQVNLGQPGTFYHFSHAQTKRKHLTKRTNRLYPTKNTMGPRISKVAWITVGLYRTGHMSFLTGQDQIPKFSRQVLPDRTESWLILFNILPTIYGLSIFIR